MSFFCCDLDNTLIYSYKHDIGTDKVLVESMEKKELSFMTNTSHRLLKEVAGNKTLVPVTTRTLKQYLRINFGQDIFIKYALISNGGILLENGIINERWLADSKKIVQEVDAELEKGINLLKRDPDVFFEIRKADGLFVFTKSSNCEKTMEQLVHNLQQEKVYIDKHGNKIYIFPRKLNKGYAVERFKDYIGGSHHFMAAGDSKFDIPMLEAVNVGMCPESLEVPVRTAIKKFRRETFTEDMLSFVKDYKSK
ncbi:MAG: HAD family hydrolase [Clostridiales bacterium]|nr:HAD family hydrolase [Clostridiales bacterium]